MAYDRSGGRLGEDIILSMYFQQNGVGADVYDIQQVEIYNPYGVLVDTVTNIENVEGIGGLYKIQWTVPVGQDEGTWTDVWKNIKLTPIAEYIDSTNTFFVVPDDQVLPTGPTTIVYAYITHPNGNPQSGLYGYIELLDAPYYLDGQYFNNPTQQGMRATSDINGRLEWTVPQGARVRISIPEKEVVLYKQLPASAGSSNIYSLGDIF
jgi:hypothetical protein